MKNLRVKSTDFTGLRNSEFPQKFSEIVSAIIAHMTTVFMNLPYTMALMEDMASAMLVAQNKASEGSKQDRETRDLQREICTNMLFTLAGAVITRANQATNLQEKINVVGLSKFTLAKMDPTPTPPLPQVSGVYSEWTGQEGQVLVEWNKIEAGALNYKVQKCFTDPAGVNPNWVDAGVTSRKKLVLNGFPQLTKVWVRVIAYGKGNEVSVPSNPSMCIVG